MTREAVVEGYERFVGDAIEQTAEEFSMSRALQGGASAPGSKIVDKLMNNSGRVRRKVVEPELETYRERAFDQFIVILAYVESDDPIEAYRDKLLETGAFENDLRDDLPEDRRETVVTYLLDRYEALGAAIEPLIERPEDEFWAAATAALTDEQARELVDEHFRFTKPIQEYPDAFRMTVTIDPSDILGPFAALMSSIRVEYTDEAIRATTTAEEQIINQSHQKIDTHFG